MPAPAAPEAVTELVRRHGDRLSPAQRRVADVVVGDPQAVAFGTVAEVAARASTSGATVVRLANALGLAGFAELQELVRAEVGHQARRATERLEREPGDDVLVDSVRRGTAALADVAAGGESFRAAVDRLAGSRGRVVVLTAEASRGVGAQFAAELDLVREGVSQAAGSAVSVARELAGIGEGDVVVALDFARYDRAVLDAVRRVATAGAQVVALSDTALSPLAASADVALVVPVLGASPFDSHVAALAVLEALVAGVAGRRRRSAAERVGRVEAAWDDAEVFTD